MSNPVAKYVTFYDDYAELFVSCFNKEVDLSIRFNRGFKSPKKIKPLDLQLICAITIADLKKQNELLYLKNARHTFLVSKVLYKKNDFRDAFLYLHLSLEHLTKYLWAKSKYAYYNKYLDEMPIPLDRNDNPIERSHDVSQSLIELIRRIPDITTKTRIRGLLAPLAISKGHGGWADVRYSANPYDPTIQQDFKSYYDNLRIPVLNFGTDLSTNGVLK